MAAKSFRYWQTSTAVGLFIGYSGYYICRSNLSIATPLIIQEFGGAGIDKEVMGQIASLGVIFYAVGKVFNGVLGDFIGGKKVFIAGMVGSVAATLFFGLSAGLTAFLVAWALNRLIQSMGWGGLTKMAVNWYSFRSYGKIMGFLSLSFLFGDIIARLLLGQLLIWDMGWRGIFMVSAAILAVLSLGMVFLLKNDPESLGFEAPSVNPNNLHNESGQTARPESLKDLLLPYFKSLPFVLMLGMSFGLTAIREAFNFWLPTYLFETAGLAEGAASQYSALYPVFGLVSIVGAGVLSDTVLRGKRGFLIWVACVLLTVVLFGMQLGPLHPFLPLFFISLTGLLLLGPYSFLAGAMSLDVGGRKGVATAAGLVDAVGYAGGTVAVWLTGLLAQHRGWNSAFFLLAVVAGLTAAAALAYYVLLERKAREKIIWAQ